MTEQSETRSAFATRDRIAMSLMLVLSAMSLVVAADAFVSLGAVRPDAVAVEAWRAFGYVVFAGLFALVGLFPRRMTGIWELILFHKAATAAYLVPYVGTDGDASIATTIKTVVLTDLMLVVVTLTAYILAQGWRAWRR